MRKWFLIISWFFLFYDPSKPYVGLQTIGDFYTNGECESLRKKTEEGLRKKYPGLNFWISPSCESGHSK